MKFWSFDPLFPRSACMQKFGEILLMEEIWRTPVEVGSLSHFSEGFINPRWLGMGFLPSTISSISMIFRRDFQNSSIFSQFLGFHPLPKPTWIFFVNLVQFGSSSHFRCRHPWYLHTLAQPHRCLWGHVPKDHQRLTQMLHVWNIYLHFTPKSMVNVGKHGIHTWSIWVRFCFRKIPNSRHEKTFF